MSASTSDILTAIKNIVIALNNATQTYLNVNGASTTEAITTATVLKQSSGRVSSVVVITPGSSTGAIYDSSATATTTNPVWTIPETATAEPYVVNMPCDAGILVVPGTGQSVTVSWS